MSMDEIAHHICQLVFSSVPGFEQRTKPQNESRALPGQNLRAALSVCCAGEISSLATQASERIPWHLELRGVVQHLLENLARRHDLARLLLPLPSQLSRVQSRLHP